MIGIQAVLVCVAGFNMAYAAPLNPPSYRRLHRSCLFMRPSEGGGLPTSLSASIPAHRITS